MRLRHQRQGAKAGWMSRHGGSPGHQGRRATSRVDGGHASREHPVTSMAGPHWRRGKRESMHTGSRPKEWNATGDLGTNHSVPAHTKRGCPNDPAGTRAVMSMAMSKVNNDLGRLNPLGALSQHRGANSQRRWMLSRTRCPFSLLDQPIQGAGHPRQCWGQCTP